MKSKETLVRIIKEQMITRYVSTCVFAAGNNNFLTTMCVPTFFFLFAARNKLHKNLTSVIKLHK